MKNRSLILLVSAVTLAAGSALLARALMRPPPPVTIIKEVEVQAPPPPPVIRVLTTSRQLDIGDFITGTDLAWEERSDTDVRADHLASTDEAVRRRLERDVYGTALRAPLPAGTPLTQDQLVRPGDPGFLATVLLPGKRAVSVPTTVVASNAGLVSAGDRVDVILNLTRDQLEAPNPMPNSIYGALAAQTIVRNVRVLALDSNTQGIAPRTLPEPATAPTDETQQTQRPARPIEPPLLVRESATLEVSPADAERLALASEVGTLQLALRGARETDTATAPQGTTRLSDTTSLMPRPPVIMTYRGAAAIPEVVNSRP